MFKSGNPLKILDPEDGEKAVVLEADSFHSHNHWLTGGSVA